MFIDHYQATIDYELDRATGAAVTYGRCTRFFTSHCVRERLTGVVFNSCSSSFHFQVRMIPFGFFLHLARAVRPQLGGGRRRWGRRRTGGGAKRRPARATSSANRRRRNENRFERAPFHTIHKETPTRPVSEPATQPLICKKKLKNKNKSAAFARRRRCRSPIVLGMTKRRRSR